MEPQSFVQLKQEITGSIEADRSLLDQLRAEIHPLKSQVHPIRERTTTSVSLVATDGGNASVQFDPFLVQIVRIVDSNNLEYCLEALTPTTNIADLSAKQFHADGSPCTALGELMRYLGVEKLQQLSHYIHETTKSRPTHSGWVQAYRELVEWAILFSLVKHPFASDTLIIYDGLLRSTIFAGSYFQKYLQGIQKSITLQKQQHLHWGTTASARPPRRTRTHIQQGRLPEWSHSAQLHPVRFRERTHAMRVSSSSLIGHVWSGPSPKRLWTRFRCVAGSIGK